MPVRRIAVAALAAALLCPAVAAAQLPARGPLLPQRFAVASAGVPRGPVGKYPEDWAECVKEASLAVGRASRDRSARGGPRRARPAARADLLRGPHGARLWRLGQVQAPPPERPGGAHMALGPPAASALVRTVHAASHGEEGARLPRPGAVRPARGRAPDDGDAPPGRGMWARLFGRRREGGCPHAGLVQRLRPGRGQRAGGDRLRARLARDPRLPGRQPPWCPAAHAALRGEQAVPAAERHDLPGGRGVRLGAGRPHRQAAPLHRRGQGARLHAERDPP